MYYDINIEVKHDMWNARKGTSAISSIYIELTLRSG